MYKKSEPYFVMLPCKGMNTAKIGGDLSVEDSRKKNHFEAEKRKAAVGPPCPVSVIYIYMYAYIYFNNYIYIAEE